jgi:hypothetical protein
LFHPFLFVVGIETRIFCVFKKLTFNFSASLETRPEFEPTFGRQYQETLHILSRHLVSTRKLKDSEFSFKG